MAPRWPPERVLFALAVSMTLLGALMAVLVTPWFLLPAVFVGLNHWLFMSAWWCPASSVPERGAGIGKGCRR